MFKSSREFIRDAKLRQEACHNLVSETIDKDKVDERGLWTGKVIAHTIGSFRENIVHSASCHAYQFMLKKELMIFEKREIWRRWQNYYSSTDVHALSL